MKFKNNVIGMFPGVGSEYYGMGKDIYHRFSLVKTIFKDAKEAVGIDFYELCFGNDKNKIKETAYAQQALVCLCYGIYKVAVEELGMKPDYLMGYSLGEYTALSCSGILQFEDALNLVKIRSKIINRVSSELDGTMAWVININKNKIEEIVKKQLDLSEQIYISAYEADEKISVSGTKKSIEVFSNIVEENKGMVVPIHMSGPFHSPLMKEASKELRTVLMNYRFGKPETNVLANFNAELYDDNRERIVDHLSLQLCNPILWQQSLKKAMSDIHNTAIEIGPKNVLQYIYDLNSNGKNSYAVESYQEIEKIKNDVKESTKKYHSILKKCLGIIISTPNQCFDETVYQIKIENEYNKLLERYKREEISSKETVIDVINKTIMIMEAKGENNLIIKETMNKLLEDILIL